MPETSRPPTAANAASCGRRFDEELLSGYLDRALTQHDEQRVRLHLEDCPGCRAELAALADLREAAMTTHFPLPADDQWDETPRGATSRWSRGAGWLLLIGWLIGVGGFAVWAFVTGPATLVEKLVIFAGASGAVLLFLSVLIDRLHTRPVDLYRRVLK